jgi:hypothetical protein
LQVSEAGGMEFSNSEVKELISSSGVICEDILECGIEVVEAGAVSGDFVKASGGAEWEP